MTTSAAVSTSTERRLDGSSSPGGGQRARRVSMVLYSVGLALSSLVGLLHFCAPYAFAWYSYIPDAPLEIYTSIDYINFLFSLLLAGLSLILLRFTRRAFEGSPELLTFYVFLVLVWGARVLVALVRPWPTPLHTWLLVGALTILGILLVPAVHLCTLRRPQQC